MVMLIRALRGCIGGAMDRLDGGLVDTGALRLSCHLG